MKKRIISLSLCACLIIALFVACGNNTTADPTKAPDPTATTAPTTAPTATTAPTTAPEPTATPEPVVEAEPIPEAKYHWAFDGTDTDLITVIQAAKTEEQIANADFGGAYDVVPSNTYVNKEGTEVLATLGYADGPVGKCLYLNGSYGIKLGNFTGVSDDTYTISFWINADRLSTYGPTLQLGHNMAMNSQVSWINFTQAEWGTNSAKIFPVVWNRNIEDNEAWPWFYGNDDAIHGKKEWVHVTLVANGQVYEYPSGETSYDLVNATMYLNGEQVFDSGMSAYGGMATEILKDTYTNDAFIGINYWDTIYKGFFDEMYIFDEALTAGQVKTLFAEGDLNVASVAPEIIEEEPEVEYTGRTDVVTNPDAIATIGTPECFNGWWSSFSDAIELADGASVNVKFKNYSSCQNNWNNFLVGFTNTQTTAAVIPSADAYPGYLEYGILRADAYGWGFAADPVYTTDWNWDDYKAIMKEVDVDMTITRTAEKVLLTAVLTTPDGAAYNYTADMTTAAAAADPMYFFMLSEQAYVEIMSIQ